MGKLNQSKYEFEKRMELKRLAGLQSMDLKLLKKDWQI